jgi:hypothetical protein
VADEWPITQGESRQRGHAPQVQPAQWELQASAVSSCKTWSSVAMRPPGASSRPRGASYSMDNDFRQPRTRRQVALQASSESQGLERGLERANGLTGTSRSGHHYGLRRSPTFAVRWVAPVA